MMKLDQIAYYAHDDEQAEELKAMLGLSQAEWISDFAEGEVTTPFGSGRSRAHLRFCYARGIELEILTYLDGPHWHMEKAPFICGIPFLSHLGYHVDGPDWVPPFGGKVVQTMQTDKHTNPYLLEKRRTYHYKIFSAPHGPDLKYIWRVEK